MNDNQVTISKMELQSLAIQSFRYCLGRMTYVVNDCDEFIRKYWQNFTANTKFLIVRELLTALKDHESGLQEIGMRCDYDVWKNLYDWMNEQHIETQSSEFEETKNE
ncbi:preprotein translocase subunit SecG [Pasteurellaceae bacterium 22721_9_1]